MPQRHLQLLELNHHILNQQHPLTPSSILNSLKEAGQKKAVAGLPFQTDSMVDPLTMRKIAEGMSNVSPQTGGVRIRRRVVDVEVGSDNVFRKNPADPMRDVMGSGIESNPSEWNDLIKQMKNDGVEIRYRDGSMAYAPGINNGDPGQLIIDADASLSALKHEYQHYLDAKAEGFPSLGAQMFEDPKRRVIKELRAYMVEIKEADRLGYKDISTQLFKNYRQERNLIINQYILPGGIE